MTDDDLTTAYILGVEHIRDKMHKQADEIERLRERLAEADECNRRVSDENEKLRAALVVEGQSSEKENRRKRAYYNEVITAEKVISELRAENEKLREALKPFKEIHDKCLAAFPNIEDADELHFSVADFAHLRAAAAAIRDSGNE